MPRLALRHASSNALRRPVAARAGMATALGLLLAALAALPQAAAEDSHARRGRPRTHRAARASQPERSFADTRWPGLAAPWGRGEAKSGWKPSTGPRLRFDAQRAWWELASLLEVLPTLPRLDGSPDEPLPRVAVTRGVSAALDGHEPRERLLLGRSSHERAAMGKAPPGVALRGVGARLLRSLGLGSIAGQAVFVLEGTVDADDADDDAVLEALPSRSWHAPSADDAELDEGMGPLRTTRGRGAMGVTTRVTLRSAAVRLVGTF